MQTVPATVYCTLYDAQPLETTVPDYLTPAIGRFFASRLAPATFGMLSVAAAGHAGLAEGQRGRVLNRIRAALLHTL